MNLLSMNRIFWNIEISMYNVFVHNFYKCRVLYIFHILTVVKISGKEKTDDSFQEKRNFKKFKILYLFISLDELVSIHRFLLRTVRIGRNVQAV